MPIRCEPIACAHCGRSYRPNKRQAGACSTSCLEGLRRARGLKTHEPLLHSTWQRKASA